MSATLTVSHGPGCSPALQKMGQQFKVLCGDMNSKLGISEDESGPKNLGAPEKNPVGSSLGGMLDVSALSTLTSEGAIAKQNSAIDQCNDIQELRELLRASLGLIRDCLSDPSVQHMTTTTGPLVSTTTPAASVAPETGTKNSLLDASQSPEASLRHAQSVSSPVSPTEEELLGELFLGAAAATPGNMARPAARKNFSWHKIALSQHPHSGSASPATFGNSMTFGNFSFASDRSPVPGGITLGNLNKLANNNPAYAPAAEDTKSVDGANSSIASLSITSPRHQYHMTRQARIMSSNDAAFELNQFSVLEVLGQGSQGKVYMAYDSVNNEFRAIKEIRRPLAKSSAMQQIKQEVNIMRKLRHQNIVRLHELIDDPSTKSMYLVMQFVEKGPFVNWIDESMCTCERVDQTQMVYFAKQLSSGLMYMHRHQIFHRDIKPENILLGRDDQVFLTDFGVSHKADFGHVETPSNNTNAGAGGGQAKKMARHPGYNANAGSGETGGAGDMEGSVSSFRGHIQREPSHFASVRGSPAYFCPEIVTGVPEDQLNTSAVDVWALGVTFFQLLTGCLPFNFSATDKKAEVTGGQPLVESSSATSSQGETGGMGLPGVPNDQPTTDSTEGIVELVQVESDSKMSNHEESPSNFASTQIGRQVPGPTTAGPLELEESDQFAVTGVGGSWNHYFKEVVQMDPAFPPHSELPLSSVWVALIQGMLEKHPLRRWTLEKVRLTLRKLGEIDLKETRLPPATRMSRRASPVLIQHTTGGVVQHTPPSSSTTVESSPTRGNSPGKQQPLSELSGDGGQSTPTQQVPSSTSTPHTAGPKGGARSSTLALRRIIESNRNSAFNADGITDPDSEKPFESSFERTATLPALPGRGAPGAAGTGTTRRLMTLPRKTSQILDLPGSGAKIDDTAIVSNNVGPSVGNPPVRVTDRQRGGNASQVHSHTQPSFLRRKPANSPQVNGANPGDETDDYLDNGPHSGQVSPSPGNMSPSLSPNTAPLQQQGTPPTGDRPPQ